MDFNYSSIVAWVSACIAAVSTWIAYQVKRNAARAERERRVCDLLLTAKKVVETTIYVDDLSDKLIGGYKASFRQANAGGGSAYKLVMGEMEKEKEAIGPMQQAAQAVLDEGPQKLADEQITKRLLELGGYQVRLDRVRDKFHMDFASVEVKTRSLRKNRS